MRPHTDFALARRAVFRDFQRGALTRLDVCDAHPELLRAGRHVGDPAPHECPVCGRDSVRYVSYVYGDKLRDANGRCIAHPSELDRLDAVHDEYARYVVEVCLECRWNHLARRELYGRRHVEGMVRPGRSRRSAEATPAAAPARVVEGAGPAE